ncbi:hypothetical protein C8J56DRAFT_926316 [Mycena floridula]|nr:hypothetical protein C8J56DRAFT_926316 [Mycena floridula]
MLSSFILFSLASSACANVFITSPVATSSFSASSQNVISWNDDLKLPALSSFGPASIGLYAGNAQQQTLLSTISASTDVSTVNSIPFTPDPNAGPSSSEYFIRFDSLSLKDATNPQFPAQAFSAKFTLTGMTGTFNAAVQAQIDGQATAPLAGATAAATVAPASSTDPSATSAKPTTTVASASHTTSSTKSSASSTKSNSVSANFNTGSTKIWAGVIAGVAVGML